MNALCVNIRLVLRIGQNAISVPEAAHILEVSEPRVRQLIAAGQLSAERFAGRWVLDIDEVKSRAKSQKNRRRTRPMSMRMAWALANYLDGIAVPTEFARSERARILRAASTFASTSAPVETLRGWFAGRARWQWADLRIRPHSNGDGRRSQLTHANSLLSVRLRTLVRAESEEWNHRRNQHDNALLRLSHSDDILPSIVDYGSATPVFYTRAYGAVSLFENCGYSLLAERRGSTGSLSFRTAQRTDPTFSSIRIRVGLLDSFQPDSVPQAIHAIDLIETADDDARRHGESILATLQQARR